MISSVMCFVQQIFSSFLLNIGTFLLVLCLNVSLQCNHFSCFFKISQLRPVVQNRQCMSITPRYRIVTRMSIILNCRTWMMTQNITQMFLQIWRLDDEASPLVFFYVPVAH